MRILSKLFGKKKENDNIRKRKDQPDVIDVQNQDEKMNWAMEKSRWTLHYFEECLKSPRSNQQYFSIKVKIEDEGGVEHIWLNTPSFDAEGNLFGVVGNKPIDVTSVSFNQKIGIDRKLISDWMIIEEGRLIGGYTIRAMRENLSGQALSNFDKGLGGLRVDYGEDYFLPDDSTPEGAIVKIETAYGNNNIEEVMACKDFVQEAKMMLAKLGRDKLNSELIDKTAEVVKLSFIKSLQDNGLPNFTDVKRAFPKREKVSENHMIITEVLYHPDGNNSMQRLNTFKSSDGWKVLGPAD